MITNVQSPSAPLKGVEILMTPTNIVAVDDVSVVLCPSPGIKNHTITIQSDDDVTAGAVQIETSNSPDYAGVWSPLGGGPTTVPGDGESLQLQFSNITFTAIRVRVTTEIEDGFVTVSYLGN